MNDIGGLSPAETGATLPQVDATYTRTALTEIRRIRYRAQIRDANDIRGLLGALLVGGTTEHCIAVYADNLLRPVCYAEIAIGDSRQACISIAQIARIALLSCSENVFVAHNHPSGNIVPSTQDRILAADIRKGLALLGIALQDCLIVAASDPPRLYSLRQDDREGRHIWGKGREAEAAKVAATHETL